jgi:hypothetical protein
MAGLIIAYRIETVIRAIRHAQYFMVLRPAQPALRKFSSGRALSIDFVENPG